MTEIGVAEMSKDQLNWSVAAALNWNVHEQFSLHSYTDMCDEVREIPDFVEGAEGNRLLKCFTPEFTFSQAGGLWTVGFVADSIGLVESTDPSVVKALCMGIARRKFGERVSVPDA